MVGEPQPVAVLAAFGPLESAIVDACRAHYGNRLVSVAVFGSVGRGTPRHDSDLDFLILAEGLPAGRMRRSDDFAAVETILAPALARAADAGIAPLLSPVIKTPEEASQGSPLFLDMIDDARVLFDRDNVLRKVLLKLRERLDRLGARRIWRGNAWFWDLKPDYRPGDEFEL